MSEHDRKRELIIESAMRRFSHYGIQKTTMSEIADDISVTQASLYYYFPDKTSLIVAVVRKVVEEYCSRLKSELGELNCLKDVFAKVISFRQEFVERYFMLHLTDASAETAIKENCKEMLEEARKTESGLIAERIKEAMDDGRLPELDPEKTSRLYLDSITGLSMFVLSESISKITPQKSELEFMAQRQRELAEIFLKGLKYRKNAATGCNKQEA